MQHGAASNAAFAQCGERLASPSQRKGCRRSGLDRSLLVKPEDLGEAGGDLRRTPLAVVADLYYLALRGMPDEEMLTL